ncbi:MAG: D-arabinono-1,4-lactone oxidase [Chloroflexota bacterium]
MKTQLNALIVTRLTFPDKRLRRWHTLLAFCGTVALASLLNRVTLGQAFGFSIALGFVYILLVSLWFTPIGRWNALGSGLVLSIGAVVLGLMNVTISFAITLLLLTYFLMATIPYVWRDRILAGQFENNQAALYRATLRIFPTAFWQFSQLFGVDMGLQPWLAEQLIEMERVRYFRIDNRASTQRWRNWSHEAQSTPAYLYHPETVVDLQQIVHEANTLQKGIRVVGRGYSWPNWVTTDDILVFCGRMNKVEIDLSDPAQPRVVAEAGATNRQINDVLEQYDLALPSNVVLEVVRIGGTVSTGSHGSGWHNPILSDYVHALDIVDANGHCRHYAAGKDSDDVMDAVRLSLGLFGIIWRVTLNVQPNWSVHMRDEHCTPAEMLANIRQWVTRYDAVDIFQFPYCPKVWVKFQERLDNDDPRIATDLTSFRHHIGSLVFSSLQMEFLRPIAPLVRRFPRITPFMGRIMMLILQKHNHIVPIADWVHHRRNVDSVRMGNIEIAFKLDDDFTSFFQAWESFETITNTYAQAGKYPMNVALNVRFLHNSTALLSPAHGDGHTCYIEVLCLIDTPHWHDYSGELAEAWLQLSQAAPHWPKQWEHIPNIDEYLRKRYAHNLRKFLDIREELQVDPNDMFVNGLTERVMRLAVDDVDDDTI